MRLDLHPEARLELLQAQAWYEQQNPGLGLEFFYEAQRAIHAVATWPRTWPADSQRFRRFLLRRFPFAIIYRLFQGRIIIIAVMHLRRRPNYWESRIH